MDVILGALLVNGNDQFRSAKKLGKGYRPVSDLDAEELWEYMAPFAGNLRRFPGAVGVVLHDGLPDDFLARYASDTLRFERVEVPARHANYERRHFAFRDWLAAHAEAGRAWLIDINDIAFGTDPFAWLDAVPADRPAVGDEWTAYGANKWFEGAARHLPAEYGELLLKAHAARCPLNCGAWAGARAVVLDTLNEMCRRLDQLRDHLDANPPPHPLVLDMWAFGAALIDKPTTLFKMDARTELNGVPSPLIHDRGPALEMTRAHDDPIGPLRAALRHTQRLPGWCGDDKAEAMLKLVLDARPALSVEIGVFGGRSLLAQALGLKHNGAGVVYGIDPWTREHSLEGGQFGDKTDKAWSDAELADKYAGVVAAVAALGLAEHVRFLCAPAQAVAEAFAPGSIDVLHIDGNHSTAAAFRDVNLYLPRVKPGGWVWFDDTDWESVKPALDPLDRAGRLVRDNGNWRLYRVG